MDVHLIAICLIIIIIFLYVLIIIWRSSSPKALYDAALDEYKQNEYKVAFEYLNKAVSIKPKYTAAIQLLGLTSLKIGDYKTAENCFLKILKEDPDRLEALYNLALTYQMAGRNEDSKNYYLKAISINDQDKDSLYNLALLLYQMGEYKEAITYFDKSMKLDPKKTLAQFYIAKCKDQMRDSEISLDSESSESVIELYTILAGKNDLPSEYNITLATAYAKAGNIAKAQEYCQKAILTVEDDIQNYKLQSLICLVNKDFACAKNNLHIAMQLNPNDQEVYDLLKYV